MQPFIRQLHPTPDTALIAIHGAGLFSSQDYENLLRGIDEQILDPLVKGTYDCFGVLYGDLIPTQTASLDNRRSDFKTKFKQQVVREQFLGLSAMTRYRGTARANADTISTRSVGSDFLDFVFKNGIDNLIINLIARFVPLPPLANEIADEVYAYINDLTFRTEVRNCLLGVLNQVAPYQQIILVSHSLGTVVALDALNLWQSDKKIAYWFTLGCPLNKVRLLRDDGTPNALTHNCVSQWYNLYDNNDIIAGVLGPNYSPPLNDSSGKPSIHDIFVEVGKGMPEAHDYLRNLLTLKFIADALQQRSAR